MKKIYTIALAAFSMLLIASSCQRFEENGPGFQPEDTFIIKAICPSEGTRTALNDTKPVWEGGDEVWVSDGTNTCKAVIAQRFDGCQSADLEVSGLSGDTFYAVYPYSAGGSVSGTNVIVNLDIVQDGEFASAGICLGTCTSAAPAITFRSACPVLHFTSNNETLVTMQLNNVTTGISGKMTVDPATGGLKSLGQSSPSIRMDFEGRHNEFYLAAAPSTFVKNGKIVFTTDEHLIGTITMSQSNTMQRGTIYEMGNLSEKIVFGSEPATNLSSRETANCYIVKSGKPYRFKVCQGNNSTPISDVAYAGVVWETKNSSSAPTRFSLVDDVIYSDGYIYFNVPSTAPEGNALIAAYGADGKILWSWHIWILDEDVKFDTYANGVFMMDRNLGSLSNDVGKVNALGLMYQWGRKDPFPGSSSISSGTESAVTGKTLTKVNNSATTGTLQYATENPWAVIYNSAGGSWLNEDMLLWSSSAKTKYDPCPPGYHIPSKDALNSIKSNLVWDSTNKGVSATVDGRTVWYPAAGRRAYSTGDFSAVGTTGYYWYDCTTGSTAKNIFYTSSSNIVFYSQNSSSPYSPCAYSVRCQKSSATDDNQYIGLTYNVTMPGYLYKSLWYSASAEGTSLLNWGDGSTFNLNDSLAVYHAYSTTGQYSVSLQGYNMKFFKIRSLGDISEIDLSNF